MRVGGREFTGGTFVMAIVNLTPDSFFSGSRFGSDNVLFAVEKAISDGAAIIDLGPQSTRPGYIEVSADTEIERLMEPLRKIKERFDIPVSVDTYFAKTACAALSAGADMINDVWGLESDVAAVVARHNAAACIMHNAARPLCGDIFPQITDFLSAQTKAAIECGVDGGKICIDGGIGFAKSAEQNFELLNNYEKLHDVGFPLLLGCSRKSMFGGKVEDRLEPTLRATRLAVQKRVLFVRVHDVKENADAIRDEMRKIYG